MGYEALAVYGYYTSGERTDVLCLIISEPTQTNETHSRIHLGHAIADHGGIILLDNCGHIDD